MNNEREALVYNFSEESLLSPRESDNNKKIASAWKLADVGDFKEKRLKKLNKKLKKKLNFKKPIIKIISENKLIFQNILFGLALLIIIFLAFNKSASTLKPEKSDTQENIKMSLAEYKNKISAEERKREQLVSSFTVSNINNVYFNAGDVPQYKIFKINAIETFEIMYNGKPISATVEFEIDYLFDTKDINFYNQLTEAGESIIIKADYNKLRTDVNILSDVTDYKFENEIERNAFFQKILETTKASYELSNNEIQEKTISFFKEHFFFIKDKFTIGIIDAASET